MIVETLLSPTDVEPTHPSNSSDELNALDRQLDVQALEADCSPSPAAQGYFWGVFWSTFITIFLAELGDKTQVTTLLMSAESQQPWVVFMGSAAALVATSLIGVLLGRWLSKRVSPKLLDTLAGVILLLITIGLVADILGG